MRFLILLSALCASVAWARPVTSLPTFGSGQWSANDVFLMVDVSIPKTKKASVQELMDFVKSQAMSDEVFDGVTARMPTQNAVYDFVNSMVSAVEMTESEARDLFSATSPIHYNSSTGNFSMNQASDSFDGWLSSADWMVFHGKQDALDVASASNAGVLSALDWIMFNAKEDSVSMGGVGQYWRGDKSWQNLTTDTVSEGSNKYYTAARAREDVVDAAVTNGEEDRAPSGEAVYNALALKQGVIPTGTSAQYLKGDLSLGAFALDVRSVALAGFSSGAGSVSAADSVLAAFEKIDGNVAGKEPTLAKGNLTEATSSVLTITGGSGAVIGSGTSIEVKQSGGSQGGYLSSGNWTTFNNKYGSHALTPSAPSRTLSSNFTPSASNMVRACYSVKVACTTSLVVPNCEGSIELRSDTNATPTTARAQTAVSLGGSIVVGLVLTNSQVVPLCYDVPSGHNVRLVPTTVSGSPTFSIITQSETALTFGQ